jgi:hypothetical protein
MAYENLAGSHPITLSASTGLRRQRFVAVGAGGKVGYPTAGAPVLGVLRSSGTTGSTADPQYVGVQVGGVAFVEASASTLAAGDSVAASSVGYAVPSSAGDYVVGYVVEGTSGAANRVLSVALLPVGTT